MPFIIAQVKTLTDVVVIETPLGHGKFEKEDIEVTFKKLSTSEFLDADERVNGDGDDDEDLREDTVHQILKENITNIDGLRNEDGESIPFDDETFEQLMDMPHVRMTLMRAFFNIQLNGEAEVKAKGKNLRKRGGTGRNRR